MGDFMVSGTSSTIYNRFSTCFGGKLKWFKFTPDQIVKLSRTKRLINWNEDSFECLNLIQDSIEIAQNNKS